MSPSQHSGSHPESPLKELLLSLPQFNTTPPPLPQIKDVFRREVHNQLPVFQRANESAERVYAVLPEKKARVFDNVVSTELKGPLITAKVVTSTMIYPVAQETRGEYVEIEAAIASILDSIPSYSPSGTTTLFCPEQSYDPSVKHQIEGGLECLRLALESAEVLGGDRRNALSHLLPTAQKQQFERLLRKMTILDGTEFVQLASAQQERLLGEQFSIASNFELLQQDQKDAERLRECTLKYLQEYFEPIINYRAALDQCLNSLYEGISTGTVSPTHFLLDRTKEARDALIQFESAALFATSQAVRVLELSDTAARYALSLQELGESIRNELRVQTQLEKSLRGPL